MILKDPNMGAFFRNKSIQSIILSNVLLQLGVWIRNFAILFFIMDKTGGDTFAVALVSIIEFAPVFLFSLVGGIYSDWWKPKTAMIWSDLLGALSVFVILLAITFGAWQGVYLITFISVTLSQFSQPSRMKLFKSLLPKEQVQLGMATYQTSMSIVAIVGPIISAFIYKNYGIHTAIVATGIAFLLSAAVLTLISTDKEVISKKIENNFWLELKEGLQYVLEEKILRLLGIIFVAFGLAVGMIQPIGVFIVTERLGLPKESFQWLLSVNGVAMLIGGTMIMGLAKKVSPQKLLLLGLLANAINVVALALSTNWYITLGIQFINGLFTPAIHIGINTLILNITKEKFVGRVNGVLNLMSMGAMVITMSLASWLKDRFSLVTIYGFSSLFFAVGVLIALVLSRVILSKSPNISMSEVK